MKNNLKVLVIGPKPPNVGGIASYIRDFSNNISNFYNVDLLFITTYIVNSKSLKGYMSKIWSILYNLYKIIILSKRSKFDIVHIHTSSEISFYENSMYITLLNMMHYPVILHIHAPDFHIFLQNSNKHFSKFIIYILNLCDFIIVLSNYWKNIFDKVISKKEKVVVIPNAANSNYSLEESQNSSRERISLPLNKKIIFSLGNLDERKGFSYLIDSMVFVSKKRTDVLCVIGGSGSIKTLLESKVDDLNLNEFVKFSGFISDSELQFWYNSCDIFVLPSLAEGSPIVMFEALSFGKPFIGTRVGGIPDVINSDDYGYIVNPKDPVDLAEKILTALDREWNSSKIKVYSKHYNWKNVLCKIMREVYLKVALSSIGFYKNECSGETND